MVPDDESGPDGAFYDALCRHLPDSVLLLDGEGVVVETNDRFCASTGRSRSELVGTHVDALAPFTNSEAAFEGFREAVTDVLAGADGERRIDLPVDSPLEGTVTVEARLTPFDHGDATGVLVVLRDVTEREAYQASIERTTEQLAVLNRVLRHDIRNDISVVLAWAEELEAHVDSAESREMLDRIVTQSNHVVELTRAAHDLVDGIEEHWEMELEPVALDAVLRREVENVGTRYPHASIDLEGPVPQVSVEATELLSSVFGNLLTNAVIHHDGDEPRVTVEVERDGETVRVVVADDGPGIPDALKDDVFGRGEMGLESPGTGMGLYLVHSLVEAFSGTVGVADNDPRGTVATVELPVAG